MSSHEDGREPAQVARDAAGAVAGTLVGGAIGGLPGAVVGAALGPAATATLHVLEGSMRVRLTRMTRALSRAAEVSGQTPEQIQDALIDSERRIDVAVAALEAAAASSVPEKLNAFAAILASTSTSNIDDELDSMLQVVKAIASLDGPHIRVLDTLSAMRGSGVSPDRLGSALKKPPESLRAIVRTLELHGLITDRGTLIPGGVTVEWLMTPLGEEALDLLRSRSEDHPDD